MTGSKGYYIRARRLLKKPTREKGKLNIGKLLTKYEIGSKVIVKMDDKKT